MPASELEGPPTAPAPDPEVLQCACVARVSLHLLSLAGGDRSGRPGGAGCGAAV